MSTEIGVWIAALLTLGIFSFLYKDNPVYKFCESLFVGTSAGYWAVTLFWDNIHKKLYEQAIIASAEEAQYHLLIGGFLGFLMLLRLVPKIGWISRWPLAAIVGATAGLYMITYFVTKGLNQVAATIDIPRTAGVIVWAEWPALLGFLIIAIGTLTGLVYFYFSKEHKGIFGTMARVGIWFLMITFGASFGYTVMSRMSLLIGRMDFLFRDWLGLLH